MIALFDLDETLICGDTTTKWNEFVIQQALVDTENYLKNAIRLKQAYLNGSIDMSDCVRHCMQPVNGWLLQDVERLMTHFVDVVVKPLIYPEAFRLLEKHRSDGDYLLLISASCRFIVEAVNKILKTNTCIATECVVKNDRCYAQLDGIPSFQEGKVIRLQRWMKAYGFSDERTCCYSDSLNDLPLLEYVDHPVATNPAPELESVARARQWPILYWNLKEERSPVQGC